MAPSAPAPPRPSRADPVALGSDAVAFLIIAPILGSALASFGLWLLLLVFAPPFAILTTIMFGGPAALASLIAARWTRPDRVLSAFVVGIVGSIAMTIHMRVLDATLSWAPPRWDVTAWPGLWMIVAFLCAAFAHGLASRIRQPGWVAIVLLGVLAVSCLIWSGVVDPRT